MQEYRLGLDLQWWIELDYTVDLSEAQEDEDYSPTKETQIIEWLKSIIDKRIETLNINDSVITTASYGWEQHIIVQIPLKWNNSLENNENIERAKEAIWKVVKIEFRERKIEITDSDREERKNIAQSSLDELISGIFSFQTIADKYALSYEKYWDRDIRWSCLTFWLRIYSEYSQSSISFIWRYRVSYRSRKFIYICIGTTIWLETSCG